MDINRANAASYVEEKGQRWMRLSNIVFIVGMIAAIFLLWMNVVVQIVLTGEFHLVKYGTLGITIGIVAVFVIGLLAKWILFSMGLSIYVTGLQLEHLKNIEENTAAKTIGHKKAFTQKRAKAAEEKEKEPDFVALGEENYVDIVCIHCQKELSFTPEEIAEGELVCPYCDGAL